MYPPPSHNLSIFTTKSSRNPNLFDPLLVLEGKKEKPRNLMSTMKVFEVSSKVEVMSNEDGFMGSYFEAKIVSKKKVMVEVEHLTLLSEEDENQMLKEVVDVSKVRPCPPKTEDMMNYCSGFEVLDRVDAYDNDVWWVGWVTATATATVSNSNYDCYSVYFDSSGDEISYPVPKLRVHQEWKDGHWILPPRM